METIALDIVPPVDGSIPAEVTPEQKEANAKRLLEEDAIRNKYVATFYTEEKAEALAKELGIDPMKTEDFMIGSRGNWMEIEKFLRETPAEKRAQAMALLDVVSAKDLDVYKRQGKRLCGNQGLEIARCNRSRYGYARGNCRGRSACQGKFRQTGDSTRATCILHGRNRQPGIFRSNTVEPKYNIPNSLRFRYIEWDKNN